MSITNFWYLKHKTRCTPLFMQDFIIQKLGFQALNFISQSVCFGILLFCIVEGIEGLVVKTSSPRNQGQSWSPRWNNTLTAVPSTSTFPGITNEELLRSMAKIISINDHYSLQQNTLTKPPHASLEQEILIWKVP